MKNADTDKNAVTYINPETELFTNGKFVKYVGPFKASIKDSQTGKVYVIDIDDMWSV